MSAFMCHWCMWEEPHDSAACAAALGVELHDVDAWPLARTQCEARIASACDVPAQYGGIGGEHHKQLVIDQMLRALLGDAYGAWVEEQNADADYAPWDVGIAP